MTVGSLRRIGGGRVRVKRTWRRLAGGPGDFSSPSMLNSSRFSFWKKLLRTRRTRAFFRITRARDDGDGGDGWCRRRRFRGSLLARRAEEASSFSRGIALGNVVTNFLGKVIQYWYMYVIRVALHVRV